MSSTGHEVVTECGEWVARVQDYLDKVLRETTGKPRANAEIVSRCPMTNLESRQQAEEPEDKSQEKREEKSVVT